jgi:hypothetical protein
MQMLIKDIKDFKEVIGGVQKSISFGTVEGFIRTAELQNIIPAIGETFHQELSNYIGQDENVKALIQRLKTASGFYALAIGAPQLVTAFGDGGIIAPQTGTVPIGKWAYVELRDSSLGQADRALEDALQYLEKYEAKKVSNVYVFNTWRNSDEYTISRKSFINSATELSEYFPAAKNSRRVYMAIRPYITRAENNFIEPLIGPELFEELKTKIADDSSTFTAEEKNLLIQLRSALAYKAFEMGIPYLNLSQDFRLVTETDGVKNENPATTGKLDGIKLDCQANAEIFSNKLKKYIDTIASSSVLSTYYDSATYTSSTANKSYYRKPIDPCKPFVSI